MFSSNTSPTNSKFSLDVGNDLISLSEHNIDCGDGLLSQMIVDHNNNKLRYKYTCKYLSNNNTLNCVDKYTPTTYNKNISDLSTSKIECDQGYGLSQVQFIENNGNYGYKYRCCKPKN